MKSKVSRELRGREALPLHLPDDYPWKVLGALHLDLKQYLSLDESMLLDQIIRSRDYHAYLILAEGWGLQCIALKDSPLCNIKAKYQLCSLIKKFQFRKPECDTRQAAIDGLFAAEKQCKEFNENGFKALLKPGDDNWRLCFFQYIRSFVSAILGSEPRFRTFVPWFRHGPGANLDTYEGLSSTFFKYENWPYSCTKGASRYARFVIETDQRWYGALINSYREAFDIPMHMPLDMDRFWKTVIRIVDYDRITTVPKDAQKDRPIAIPPSLNIFLQLGVDGFIRRRLLQFGINLNCQRKNQALARQGSVTGEFATLDLSSASDTISLKFCEMVLPKPWFDLLSELRCPKGYLVDNDEFITYEKMCSMGNGYTFVLESTLFAAICFAAIKASGGRIDYGKIAIYGDDLIVPTEHFARVHEGLRLCGFKLNTDKTFFFGPVRESCGTDWLEGHALRPVFMKSFPEHSMELFNDFNRLKRYLLCNFGIESNVSKVCQRIYRWIPILHRQIIGPYSDTDFDGYLHTDVQVPNSSCAYQNGMLYHTRFYRKARKVAAPDFFFRKLMHQLNGRPIEDLFRWTAPTGGAAVGSRFTAFSKESVVRTTSSVIRSWNDEYDERVLIKQH